MKPSHFYFDDSILEREQILFNHARYLAHELLVDGYYTLPQENEGRMLIRNRNGLECMSNVCRHRQATMLRGAGQRASIVCPLHGWTYDLEGQLIAAPFFEPCPDRSLRKFDTQTWNGMIFARGKDIVSDLAQMRLAKHFDFAGYTFHSRREHVCNYNWKTFIEVYMDDYHVVPFHPGLGNFVDCNKLDWQFGTWYSVQSVGVNNQLRSPGTDVYKRWHKVLMDYRRGAPPEFGAIWLTIYPNVMVEWYPEVLVISTLWPESPQRTRNIVEFYYPEEIAHFEADFVEAHQAAYMETAYEDDEIAERMDQGRSHHNKFGYNDVGPIHDPMELGLKHFYEYYDQWIFHNFEMPRTHD
jgi:choline monooxygenase